MKKVVLIVAIFCTYSLGVVAQDSTWKSSKRQKGMGYKNKKDSMNMWPSNDSTMKKNKMWKKGMKDSTKNKGMDSMMIMNRKDSIK